MTSESAIATPVLTPTFAELGVRPEITSALAEAGIVNTFAIQELTLPLALAGEDLIGQARTGTGKTLGFGVPLLQRIVADNAQSPLDGSPRALVIVPTRELCVQVTEDLAQAAKNLTVGDRGLSVHAIYGGRPYESQIAALQAGVDVVAGTPGRLMDLAKQGHLVLAKIKVLVLDEADEMLDLGFLPDIERILTMVPTARQTMLFSATMPGPIITLARTFLSRPTHIRAEEPESSAVHERTKQYFYRAHALDKVEMIARILQAEDRGRTMVFSRTKRTAQKVCDELIDRGFKVGAVHGDLSQGAREQALTAFREGKIDTLVATDVAARGIDVEGVTHVINYQCPEDEKTYVHRIGRTGRAGRTGIAVTLVDWDDMHRFQLINTALALGVPEPVETYSTSPHLFSDLSIPAGATGRTGEVGSGLPPRVGSRGARKGADAPGTRKGPDAAGASRPPRAAGGSGGAASGAETAAAALAGGEPLSLEEPVDVVRPARTRSRRRSRPALSPAEAGEAITGVVTVPDAAASDAGPASATGTAAGTGPADIAGEAVRRPRRQRSRSRTRRPADTGDSSSSGTQPGAATGSAGAASQGTGGTL